MSQAPVHNCRPPGCPGMHTADDPPCPLEPFTCECGKRWEPTGSLPGRDGWRPADGPEAA